MWIVLPLVPCTVIDPSPKAAACDGETPIVNGTAGVATYGGPVEKPTGATAIPAGRFGKVIVTESANPSIGTIDTISSAPPPSCCSDIEDGERETLKSGAVCFVLFPPAPQATSPTVMPANAMNSVARNVVGPGNRGAGGSLDKNFPRRSLIIGVCPAGVNALPNPVLAESSAATPNPLRSGSDCASLILLSRFSHLFSRLH